MSSKMFVNLPVQDLKKSMAFFQAIGYSFEAYTPAAKRKMGH